MSEPHVVRRELVVPVPVDPSGRDGPTPHQARGPYWRRTAPGLYAPSHVADDRVEQRIVEVATGLPEGTAITGWAALCWMGATWFDGLAPDGQTRLPVPVAVDDRRRLRQRPGARLSEDWLFDDDVIVVDGVRVTVPNRSVTWQTRRARSVRAAVQVIDMAAYDDLVDLEGLGAYVARLPARPGVRRLRIAVELADENAWSPQEPPMRVVWTHDAHLPRPLCNVPVFDCTGRHLFTPDLIDPEAGVVGEYDGAIHSEAEPRRRDLNREALLRDHGLELATMMSGDRRDTADFVARLRAAYRRARARGLSGSWTVEQPEHWVDTSTVARRRALTVDQWEIWVGWRKARRT